MSITNNELILGDWILMPEKSYHYRKAKVIGIYKNIIDCITPDNIEHTFSYNDIEPIPITQEILEENGFKYDAFTNLSADFYYEDDSCSICINLNSTCDKHKSIFVNNKNLKITVLIEESRQTLQKKPLFLHELQHILRLLKIEKEIKLF